MHRIMVVDDDAVSLAIARAVLEDKYEVSLMHSAQHALGALKSEILPELILLDWLMPGINGMEFLEMVRHDDRLKEIPVIFLTGELSDDLEIKGYACGASGFLRKPVNRDLVEIKIQQQFSYVALKRENFILRNRLNLLEGK